MRILFTSHAGTSHLRVLMPLAQAAARQGHDVAVSSAESMREQAGKYGLRFLPAGIEWSADPFLQAAIGWPLLRGDNEAYERALIDKGVLGGPALAAARDIIANAGTWRPDLVVREGEEMGGYLAAEALGIPHAAVASGSTHLLTQEVVREPLERLRAQLGLPPEPDDLTCYRHMLINWLPRDFAPEGPETRTLRFHRETTPDFGEERVPSWFGRLPAGTPVVYAAMGTVAPTYQVHCDRALREIVGALSETHCSGIVHIGIGRDPADFGTVPPHVRLVNTWLPQSVLLQGCDLFITHGGIGGIREALRARVPMLVIPFMDDQPHNAERCVAAGIGLTMPAHSVTSDRIRKAAHTLLDDPSYRLRVVQMHREVLARPSLDDLVRDLESLAGGFTPATAA
jgi:N-glycosyltransferase